MMMQRYLSIVALALAGAAVVFATAGSPAPAPLIMACHELIQGAPDPVGNRYVLTGDVLKNHEGDQEIFLSSSQLSMLSTYNSSSRMSTWASHKDRGPQGLSNGLLEK